MAGSFFVDERQENQNLIDAKFEYDNEMWSWNKAQAWNTYYNTLEAQYVAQLNHETTQKYQNQLAFNTWQDKENMRLYSYAKEIEAYNASVNSYYKQLDFNTIAEELTLNDTARAYQDQLISIGFQNEDLMNKYLAGEEDTTLATDSLNDKLGQAKAAEQLQIRETNINKEFDLINDTLDKAGLRDGLAATKADAAFKIQGMKTESIQKVGQQQALGQVGKSAEKAMQSILANYGNAQLALLNSVSSAEDKYQLDLKKLAAVLQHKTDLSDLQYSTIANQLANTREDISREQEKVNLKFSQLATDTDLGREQLDQSLISAQRQNEADKQRIGMDKFQADINASQSLKTVPTAPPMQQMPLMLPDTVYNKIPTPIDAPLPVRNINTVHNTAWADAAVNVGLSVATKFIGPTP